VRTARLVGWALGAGILVSSFFLPFWNFTTGGAQLSTLYGTFRFTIDDLGTILGWNFAPVTALAAAFIVAFALVEASGVLGAYPTSAGALGVLGMLVLTVVPVLVFPSFDFSPGDFGAGYWAIWALSAANLFVGFFVRNAGTPEADSSPPPMAQAQPASDA
jgi:hypothetical protein